VDIQSHWTWSSTLLQSANQAFQYVSFHIAWAHKQDSEVQSACLPTYLSACAVTMIAPDTCRTLELLQPTCVHQGVCLCVGRGWTILVCWRRCGTDSVLWHHCCVHQGEDVSNAEASAVLCQKTASTCMSSQKHGRDCCLQKRAPTTHTVLEIVQARWGTGARLVGLPTSTLPLPPPPLTPAFPYSRLPAYVLHLP